MTSLLGPIDQRHLDPAVANLFHRCFSKHWEDMSTDGQVMLAQMLAVHGRLQPGDRLP